MQLQTFPNFKRLPAEICAMIWREVAGMTDPRRIVVVIRATNPAYVPHAARRAGSQASRALGGPHAHVRWTWTCYATEGRYGPPGFVGMLGASRESRGEYQRMNPQFLRIENGPVIRFNATRDMIFMDATSLFSLHMYTIIPDHLLPIPTWPANLQGFNTIQNLQTSLRNNNISGLIPGHGFFVNGAVLAGAIAPVTIWRPPPNRMVLDVANDYRPLGVWHWLNDEREAMLNTHHAASQVVVINRYFDQAVPGVGGPGLLDEVDRFFLER
ncbi:hypothetical protein IFR04_005660 [Cadophora malorum]|uniref:2EXR domain-containing protein n=1 Tax=Cadophora malorum TaxID=108018 RepID=A0A8H7TGN3_9HELO|nr:hypothetical protein IFR04_005660 [Cadophora malorum]